MGGLLLPCVLELPGWRDPLDLLAASRGRRRVSLLWSGAGPGASARYSILAADPFLTVSWKDGRAEVSGPEGGERSAHRDPFDLILRLLERYPSDPDPRWPFGSGAIGYFSYDAARALERIDPAAADDRDLPHADFAFHSWAICWDHARRRWAALATGSPPGPGPDRNRRAELECRRIADWATSAPPAAAGPAGGRRVGAPSLEPSLDRQAYLEAVAAIKRLIESGECYEVNLSRRVTARARVDPRRLFLSLAARSPAPFSSYIEGASCVLVGSSPERLLRASGGWVESRPIKGTARRSAEILEDVRAAETLKRSPKDRAENVMIVDLVRHDLGRVCDPGTISVTGLCDLESYTGVHHLVSTIRGRLVEGKHALDAARALFPAGSMTGAPKIRSMQVIESLERVRRGPYAGAAGYVTSSREADLSVVIRTLVVTPEGVDLQTGGAIVADSDPVSEYEEAILKGRAAESVLLEEVAVSPEPILGERPA